MSHPTATILNPVCALVVLTAIVWFRMYYVRFSEMKKAGITVKDMYPSNRNLPKAIITSGDNFRNLCEIPILFYLACVLIFFLGLSDHFFVACAWLYVVLRYVHSFIHTTYNKIAHRFIVYFSSTIILWFMWLVLIFKIVVL